MEFQSQEKLVKASLDGTNYYFRKIRGSHLTGKTKLIWLKVYDEGFLTGRQSYSVEADEFYNSYSVRFYDKYEFTEVSGGSGKVTEQVNNPDWIDTDSFNRVNSKEF